MKTFPKPDRSDQIPSVTKTDEDPSLDIGWDEGTLPDGRPWRGEVWELDGHTFTSIWFSHEGLEELSDDGLAMLLSDARLLDWGEMAPRAAVMAGLDASFNPMWIVIVIVADEEGQLLDGDGMSLKPYLRGDGAEGRPA